MVYGRKAATAKLKTFSKLETALWERLSYLAKDSKHVDIVFDLQLENTITYGERVRHQKTTETCARNLYITKEKKIEKPEKHNLINAIEAKLQEKPIKYVPIDDKTHNFAQWYMQGQQPQPN